MGNLRKGGVFVIAAFCILVFLAGCDPPSPPTVLRREPLGRVQSAQAIPTGFGPYARTQVIAEQGFVVIVGTPTIPFGESAEIVVYIVVYNDGQRWFDIGGRRYPAF